MADNNPTEALVDGKIPDSTSIIVPFLFLVMTGSGMCISGLGYAAVIFNTRSFLTALIFLIVISLTYWMNSKIIVKACYEKLKLSSHEPYSYSRLIHHLWGRKRGLTIQLSMALHNIIILTYLQQRIAANAFRVFHPDTIENNKVIPSLPTYTDTFYYIALANIPLILLALQNKYDRVKYFAIFSILVWVYLFIGVITEAADSKTGNTAADTISHEFNFLPAIDETFIVTIGLLSYFMSYFQIIPFVSAQAGNQAIMEKVLKYSAIGSVVLVGSVLLYFITPFNGELNVIRYSGMVLIGACITIINIVPTREFIVQILEENAKEKQQTRDRFITLALLSLTLVLSLFINGFGNWKVFVGIGTILTGFLGFIFPAIVFLKIADSEKEKNTKIIVTIWNVLLGLTVIFAGFFMMFVESMTGKF